MPLLARLVILFLTVPVMEMLILIQTGKVLGFWPTLGLLIVLGLLGIYLVKSQGFMVFQRIRHEIARGQIPTSSLLDGLLVLVSGILLITPGLLTDLIGLAILVPPVRRLLREKLKRLVLKMFLPRTFLRIRW